MSGDSKSDPPPYSRFSNNQPLQVSSPTAQTFNRPGLLQGLSRARSEHLRGIVYTKILPIVEQRAAFGLAHTEIALIPSKHEQTTTTQSRDVFGVEIAQDPAFSSINELENIDADDETIQLPLTSLMDTSRFWSQKAVVEELRVLILEALTSDTDNETIAESNSSDNKSDGHSLSIDQPRQAGYVAPVKTTSQRPTSRLSRLTNLIKTELAASRQPMRSDSSNENIRVRTMTDEVCTRTTNAFGLYETLTREAVIVNISLGDLG